MTSKNSSNLPDLERDIPTTPEDVRALRENRPVGGADWLEQLQILVDQIPPEVIQENLRRRKTFEGCEPFEL